MCKTGKEFRKRQFEARKYYVNELYNKCLEYSDDIKKLYPQISVAKRAYYKKKKSIDKSFALFKDFKTQRDTLLNTPKNRNECCKRFQISPQELDEYIVQTKTKNKNILRIIQNYLHKLNEKVDTEYHAEVDELLLKFNKRKRFIKSMRFRMLQYNTLYEVCDFLNIDFCQAIKMYHPNSSFFGLINDLKRRELTFKPVLYPEDPHYYDIDIQYENEYDCWVDAFAVQSAEEFIEWYDDYENIELVIREQVHLIDRAFPVEEAILLEDEIHEIERREVEYVLKHYCLICRFPHHGATDRE